MWLATMDSLIFLHPSPAELQPFKGYFFRHFFDIFSASRAFGPRLQNDCFASGGGFCREMLYRLFAS